MVKVSRETSVAVNARAQMNGIDNLNPDSSRYGYRASATYIDQFADDTIGLALGYAHMSSPYQSERFNAWGYPTYTDGNLLTGGVGTRGDVVGGRQVTFTDPVIASYAREIAADELAHVRFLRTALGSGAVVAFALRHGLDASPLGDALMLYTDGLVEGRDLPLDEGIARLREVVLRQARRALLDVLGDPQRVLGGHLAVEVLHHPVQRCGAVHVRVGGAHAVVSFALATPRSAA